MSPYIVWAKYYSGATRAAGWSFDSLDEAIAFARRQKAMITNEAPGTGSVQIRYGTYDNFKVLMSPRKLTNYLTGASI